MKLLGQVDLHIKGEPVLRSPNALDKLKRAFGGEPDLRTTSVKTSLDLYLAFHSNAPVFGKDFSMLRLAVEHDEAGLHLVLEVQARSVHPDNEPAARVVISGRVKAFEPHPGEDAEAYRLRVEPLTQNAAIYEMHRRQFETFVSLVAAAALGGSAWVAALPTPEVKRHLSQV